MRISIFTIFFFFRFLHHLVNATLVASAPEEPKWGTLHLVGHSLGAHICGLAAKEFKKRQSNWEVSRITGLDPAQPCFNNISLALQLDISDAPFVDVIHTNGRLMAGLGLGLPNPIGSSFSLFAKTIIADLHFSI